MDNITAQSNLTEKQLTIYNGELTRRSKGALITYLLFIFLSPFGAHHFYLSQTARGIGYLALSGAFWFMSVLMLGAATAKSSGGTMVVMLLVIAIGGAGAIWRIIDLFTIPAQVRNSNERTGAQILKRLETTG